MKERDHIEGLGVYGGIILQQIFKKYYGYMDRNYVVVDSGRWQALVKAVMTSLFP
jgi:hypothetical protein